MSAFALLVSMAAPAVAQRTQPPIDVVLDLDWTAFYPLKNASPAEIQRPGVLKAGEEHYRAADGLVEFVAALLDQPGLRLSIFSGGEKARNESLAGQTLLADGTRLRDRVHVLLSKEDLTFIPGAEDRRFPERLKKDLRKIAPDLRPERAVLVDDIANFNPVREQETLWLQKTFVFSERFEAPGAEPDPYRAPTEAEWAAERNKLARALGLILIALEKSRTGPTTFRDALHALMHDAQGRLVPVTDPSQARFFLRGWAAMDELNPRRNRAPLHVVPGFCEAIFR